MQNYSGMKTYWAAQLEQLISAVANAPLVLDSELLPVVRLLFPDPFQDIWPEVWECSVEDMPGARGLGLDKRQWTAD